jgi:hypothetical protein
MEDLTLAEKKSDPPDNPGIYVLKDDCYTTHLAIAERLTKVEILNVGGILASIATLLGVVYMLWRMFG